MQINGTTVIDSSRNLTNIGTIVSTNITSNGSAVVVQSKPLTVVGQPIIQSSPNSAKLQLKQTTASTTARKGGLEWYSATGGYAAGSISIKGNGASDNSGIMEFHVTSEDDEVTDPYDLSKILTLTDTSATIAGSLSKQSGSFKICLLYTSPSPRDGLLSRMPSSA